jgi:hypothetical protein
MAGALSARTTAAFQKLNHKQIDARTHCLSSRFINSIAFTALLWHAKGNGHGGSVIAKLTSKTTKPSFYLSNEE